MQILKKRNLWPENGRRSDGVGFFFTCPKIQIELGAIQTPKESPGAVYVVCWQLNRGSKSKTVVYRKNWRAVDS